MCGRAVEGLGYTSEWDCISIEDDIQDEDLILMSKSLAKRRYRELKRSLI